VSGIHGFVKRRLLNGVWYERLIFRYTSGCLEVLQQAHAAVEQSVADRLSVGGNCRVDGFLQRNRP
jgi:hypothetical protein